LFPRDQAAKDAVARLHGYAREIGRDPATIGMEGSVRGAGRNPEDWLSDIKEWEELGATGVSVGTGGAGLTSADQHIDVLRQFKEAMMT
jgi:hypothetical protein